MNQLNQLNQVNQVNQVNSPKLSYRAEIDGLRAIAVVSVILYHAQMVVFGRDWFEGGFIGVDIFFVISGYLITRIILFELESKGSFSFLNFYERRARRILPMLFVVVLTAFVYGFFTLLPNEIRELSLSSLFSILFTSNFYFFDITTEYGAENSLLKPMLHTWSLGVEEQFYLVFPILAIIAFRYFHKYFLTILVGLSLLSLQFAELMEVRNADLNFFLPFSRFWELAVGSMLAYRELYYKPSNEGFASKSLPMIGLYLIAYSILFFDAKTPHPSFHTLIPIIGVALIIGFSSKDELVGKVLGFKPFVWIGLISYSAYLWHFPIFAFSRIEQRSLSNYDKIELMIGTAVISALGYFLIEKPIRRKISSKHFFIALPSVTACLILGLSYVGYSKDFEDFWLKFTSNEKTNAYLLIRDTQAKTPLVNEQCIFNVIQRPSYDLSSRISSCRAQSEKVIYILGDSHALNLFNMFSYSDQFSTVVGSTQGGCRPHGCNNTSNQYVYFKEKIVPLVKRQDIIIFHQSGSYLIADLGGYNDSQKPFRGGDYTIDNSNIKKVADFLNDVANSVDAQVIWLGPFLEYRQNPKNLIREYNKNGLVNNKYFAVNPYSPIIFDELETVLLALKNTKFRYVSFDEFYEVEQSAIVRGINGVECFQFRDRDHFTECGERRIGKFGSFDFLSK